MECPSRPGSIEAEHDKEADEWSKRTSPSCTPWCGDQRRGDKKKPRADGPGQFRFVFGYERSALSPSRQKGLPMVLVALSFWLIFSAWAGVIQRPTSAVGATPVSNL